MEKSILLDALKVADGVRITIKSEGKSFTLVQQISSSEPIDLVVEALRRGINQDLVRVGEIEL